jgi:hypothetical protein
LPHFHLGHDQSYGAIAIDPYESIGRKGGRSVTLSAIQREAKQQTTSGSGTSFHKCPPGNTVQNRSDVGTAMSKRFAIHLNLPYD